MRLILIFLAVFLYADISEILLKIEKIENYSPRFDKIYIKGCEKKKRVEEVQNQTSDNKTELKLLAIFNDKALINNKWVKEGDFIEGFKVKKIYPKKVILQKNGKILILKFNTLLKVEN